MRRIGLSLGLLLLVSTSCSHAPPQVVQVFSQVNRVYSTSTASWTFELAAFVQAASSDGTKVFDRLHLVHDASQVFVTVDKSSWTVVEKPGEFWVGVPAVTFPDGRVPTGEWRAVLVTRSGQKVETRFQVPPSLAAVAPRSGPVAVTALGNDKFRVSGWVDDYLVWVRDAKGVVTARNKTVGAEFSLARGWASFELYSYDKERGEGLRAGPFPVQVARQSADR